MKRAHHFHSKKTKHTAASHQFLEGQLQLKGKFGFVLSEKTGVPDVLVQGPSLQMAMGDDRVKVRLYPVARDGRRSGEIVEVVKHARETVVGTFRTLNGQPSIVPQDAEMPITIENKKNLNPAEGDVVVGKITVWPSRSTAAKCVLVEVLGSRNRPDLDLQALIRRYELPHEFSPAAENEARAYGADVAESAYKNRHTYFDQNVFTIDGSDAKDFDDAVSLEPTAHGWKLGVHIADVASYVKEKTALDEEAYKRGTSVYLSGSVLPMLPFTLSDGLCSLRPHVVRLTMTCEMEIDRQGRVTHHRIFESAIKSCRRFTYEEVEQVLAGQNVTDVTPSVASDVREMNKLANLLREKRFSRGSLDFDFPEASVSVDPHGRPIDIQKKERLKSHRLIEDFMLLANETVARHMKNTPFLYRVHEKPDPVKLQKLKKTLEAVGVPVPSGFESGRPMALQKVIASSVGRPIQGMVQIMVLRSLKQAVYLERNAGHYGLASECYTHFTSPIRRYPDLVVHRLLKEQIMNKLSEHRKEQWGVSLPAIAQHTSKRERVAVEAEREYFDIQKARFMQARVGETFDGVISGVTNFGFFVQLNDVFVEGLVHVTNLKGDYFIFDEVRMTLSGKRSGRAFRIGQSVRVLLAGVNLDKHQLDLELVTPPKTVPLHRKTFNA